MTEPTWPDLVNSLCTGVPPALPTPTHERAAAWARWLRDPDRSHNPNAHELIAELLDTLAVQVDSQPAAVRGYPQLPEPKYQMGGKGHSDAAMRAYVDADRAARKS